MSKVGKKSYKKIYLEYLEKEKINLKNIIRGISKDDNKITLPKGTNTKTYKIKRQGFILPDGTIVLKRGNEEHLELLPQIYIKLGIQGEQTMSYAVEKAGLIMIDTDESKQKVTLIIPPNVTKDQIIGLSDLLKLQNKSRDKWDRGSVTIFLTYYDKAEEKVEEEEDSNVAATRFESIIRGMLNGQLGDEERRKIERLLENFTTRPPGLMDQHNDLSGEEQGEK